MELLFWWITTSLVIWIILELKETNEDDSNKDGTDHCG